MSEGGPHVSEDVNRGQVRVLLDVYRKIDLRAGALGNAMGRRAKSKEKAGVGKIVLVYGFYGLIFGMFAMSRMPSYLFTIIMATYTAVMVCLFITAEAGTLLFNTADTEVLGHLPISPKTYFRAKCINLLNYILLISVPLNVPPALMGIACRGAGWQYPLGHMLAVLLMAATVASTVILFYGMLMRYVRKERLQSVITYSQIALTIVFVFGYQIVPRVMQTYKFGEQWHGPWWLHLFPPAWFASICELVNLHVSRNHLAHAAGAVALAGVTIYLGLHRFAADYQSTISQMAEQGGSVTAAEPGTGTDPATPGARPIVRRGRLSAMVAQLMRVRRPEERAMFDLVWLQCARDNEVKQRLYPSLAWMIGMPVLGIITKQAADPMVLGTADNPVFSYFAVVLTGSLSLTVLELLLYSRNPDAAFIFQVCPVEKLQSMYSGILKAMLGGIVLPLVIIMTGLFAWLWHSPAHAAMHVLPWLFVLWPLCYLPFLWHEYLPFSRAVREGQQATRNIGVMFGVMIGLGGLGFVQHVSYIMNWYWYFAGTVAALCVVAAIVLRWLVSRRRYVLISV